jgi:hypothetical protein
MKTLTTLAMALGLLAVAGLPGCKATEAKPLTPSQPPRYSTPQLISMVEQNTQNLNCFRSKGGKLSSKILTDKGLKKYDLDGVAVLYQQPKNMYLSGSFLGQPALQIGSNADRYWLGVMHDPSRLNWGFWKYADSECNEWRMGGPMKLLEAIGQVNLRDLEGKLLGPVLKRDPSANILMYMAVDMDNNWFIAKEVFLSSCEPIVIDRIIYYNPDGTEYLVIRFSDYEDVGPGARMAQQIRLDWPADQSYMQLNHGRVTLNANLPQAAFTMPDPGTFNEVDQVDSKCVE